MINPPSAVSWIALKCSVSPLPISVLHCSYPCPNASKGDIKTSRVNRTSIRPLLLFNSIFLHLLVVLKYSVVVSDAK